MGGRNLVVAIGRPSGKQKVLNLRSMSKSLQETPNCFLGYSTAQKCSLLPIVGYAEDKCPVAYMQIYTRTNMHDGSFDHTSNRDITLQISTYQKADHKPPLRPKSDIASCQESQC